MANTWLRLWHDMPNDPKWRTISRISGQPISLVQATYVHILVSASQNVTRGHTDVTSEDLASALDVTEEQISSVMTAMQGRVLDGNYVSGWERRQVKREEGSNPDSPAMTAAERKRKQRERDRQRQLEEEKNDDVTRGHDKSRVVTTDKDKDKDKDLNKDLLADHEKKSVDGKTDYSPEFEQAWESYPKRSGSNPKKRAFESWSARLKEGVSPAELLSATQRYRKHCSASKKSGTEFVMQAQRFFGTGREFENEWVVPFDPMDISEVDTTIPFGFRGAERHDQ